MVGWHHKLNEREFEQTPGDSAGQRSLACCSPWGHKESGTTERLNLTETRNYLSEKSQYPFWAQGYPPSMVTPLAPQLGALHLGWVCWENICQVQDIE